jgi:YgiT-type zinc finger domain-containing protein
MMCAFCGGPLRRATAPFHADRAGYHVHWDAVPAWVCGQCGEAAFDSREVDAIQAALSSLDVHARLLTQTEASTTG